MSIRRPVSGGRPSSSIAKKLWGTNERCAKDACREAHAFEDQSLNVGCLHIKSFMRRDGPAHLTASSSTLAARNVVSYASLLGAGLAHIALHGSAAIGCRATNSPAWIGAGLAGGAVRAL